MKLTNEEIKDLAEIEAIKAGFWGVEIWWRDAYLKFRKFLKLVEERKTSRDTDSKDVGIIEKAGASGRGR